MDTRRKGMFIEALLHGFLHGDESKESTSGVYRSPEAKRLAADILDRMAFSCFAYLSRWRLVDKGYKFSGLCVYFSRTGNGGRSKIP
jgi:hypothetical protein